VPKPPIDVAADVEFLPCKLELIVEKLAKFTKVVLGINSVDCEDMPNEFGCAVPRGTRVNRSGPRSTVNGCVKVFGSSTTALVEPPESVSTIVVTKLDIGKVEDAITTAVGKRLICPDVAIEERLPRSIAEVSTILLDGSWSGRDVTLRKCSGEVGAVLLGKPARRWTDSGFAVTACGNCRVTKMKNFNMEGIFECSKFGKIRSRGMTIDMRSK
jgi:hypothetical protein